MIIILYRSARSHPIVFGGWFSVGSESNPVHYGRLCFFTTNYGTLYFYRCGSIDQLKGVFQLPLWLRWGKDTEYSSDNRNLHLIFVSWSILQCKWQQCCIYAIRYFVCCGKGAPESKGDKNESENWWFTKTDIESTDEFLSGIRCCWVRTKYGRTRL